MKNRYFLMGIMSIGFCYPWSAFADVNLSCADGEELITDGEVIGCQSLGAEGDVAGTFELRLPLIDLEEQAAIKKCLGSLNPKEDKISKCVNKPRKPIVIPDKPRKLHPSRKPKYLGFEG